VTRPLITDLSSGGNDITSLLTSRELEVLRLVGVGKANKEIAAALVISERTARTHVSNVLRKIGVSSRTQAAVLAVREGLVAPPEREGARFA
jgi:DNA-binding NarL/FixJ family response regulator